MKRSFGSEGLQLRGFLHKTGPPTTSSVSTAAFSAQMAQYTSSGTLNQDGPGNHPQADMAPKPSPEPAHVSSLERHIYGWSWQAFPIGMGTGAVCVTLSGLKPHPYISVIETVFYFLDIVVFVLNIIVLGLQLIYFPHHAKKLITDPAKGIFVPLIVLTFATIIIGTTSSTNLVFPPGTITAEVVYGLFWTYVALSVVISFPMLMIWFNHTHELINCTPAWAFLVFPMMLVGIIALHTLDFIPPTDRRAIIVLVTGYMFQGLGVFVTLFYICIYMSRIMVTGLLTGAHANSAFVACGPPGFTALALINLGQRAQTILPAHNLISSSAGEIWYVASLIPALMLFGLAIFFFAFGILPYAFNVDKHLSGILGCWALTFPNTGWILTLPRLAELFGLPAFYTWFVVMAILMCMTWTFLIIFTFLAFFEGKIFTAPSEEIIRDRCEACGRERVGTEPHNDCLRGDVVPLGAVSPAEIVFENQGRLEMANLPK